LPASEITSPRISKPSGIARPRQLSGYCSSALERANLGWDRRALSRIYCGSQASLVILRLLRRNSRQSGGSFKPFSLLLRGCARILPS
jgi:hypothetical protein